MSESRKDPLATFELNPPLNDSPASNSAANSSQGSNLTPVEKHCLENIDAMREHAVKERDPLVGTLQFMAATSMEIALRYDSGVRKLITSETVPVHTVPDIHRILGTKFGLNRQYHRDLELVGRIKQTRLKAARSHDPLRSNVGINPVEKPR